MSTIQGRPFVEECAQSREWNHAVGEFWTDILRGRRLERGTVMEIGPGFSDKIAHGLAALGFRGTIVLVEPNEPARRWAVDRYRRLLPQAQVVAMATRVQHLRVSNRIDAVLANHVLDDLLIDAWVPASVSAHLFSTMRPDASCSLMFVETWRQILASSLPSIHELANDVASSIASIRPGLLALNDYPSWRHSAPVLAPIHRVSQEMMKVLASQLRAHGRSCVLRNTGSMQWLTGGSIDAAR
jgi:hypothetical protein